MQKGFIRQIVILLSLAIYISQASASVGVAHTAGGAASADLTSYSNIADAALHVGHQQRNHDQSDVGLHVTQAEPVSAEDCCAHVHNCGTGHCSATLAVSSVAPEQFDPLHQRVTYDEESYANAYPPSPFKPPVSL